MELRGKIFLKSLPSWSVRPFGLLIAHASQIAQHPEFILSILAITSILSVQLYLNGIFSL